MPAPACVTWCCCTVQSVATSSVPVPVTNMPPPEPPLAVLLVTVVAFMVRPVVAEANGAAAEPLGKHSASAGDGGGTYDPNTATPPPLWAVFWLTNTACNEARTPTPGAATFTATKPPWPMVTTFEVAEPPVTVTVDAASKLMPPPLRAAVLPTKLGVVATTDAMSVVCTPPP